MFVSSSLLPVAYCLLPIVYCLLPIVYCHSLSCARNHLSGISLLLASK
jgi:hypothetical protein